MSCNSVVIALTALNYIYASSDEKIGEHDVICANEEVASWISKEKKKGLRKIYILPIIDKVYIFNHSRQKPENKKWDNIRKNKYSKFYLCFSSGWHFNWLQKVINLKIEKSVFIDDGTHNIMDIKTRFCRIKNILSYLLTNQKNSFSKYTGFNNKKVENIITIYSKINTFNIHKPKKVIDISHQLSHYCKSRIQTNKVLFPVKYGLYMTSDIGAYNSNHEEILEKIKKRLEFLRKKTGVKWAIKCKRTDPLYEKYIKKGLVVTSHTINQELMLDSNLEFVCTNYDTFLLNMIVLKLPLTCYIRTDEKRREMHEEMKDKLIQLKQNYKNIKTLELNI